MPVGRAKTFFDHYTTDLTSADVRRLFTQDTREAYRFFTRHADTRALDALPWYRRIFVQLLLVFSNFTMRLSPARRALYGIGVVCAVLGLALLFRGIEPQRILIFPFSITLPLPSWVQGTLWLATAFLLLNLLILMEVADRLSLKGDLEIARDIQLAMLPSGVYTAGEISAAGVTRPANTVGGDFYDILPLPDGRIAIAVGDVAGKGSPAALLMALLLAMLRTLVDEGMDAARLAERLNIQVLRHSPASRFITLFLGFYDPATWTLRFVNAGHLPPMLRRADGTVERVGAAGGSVALGMFEGASYETQKIILSPGDVLVLFSDGITEAENASGVAFDDAGLEAVVRSWPGNDPQELGATILTAVRQHAGDVRLADDLTAMVLTRHHGVVG
jgi:sigma-B regulation protein RsbU (phosphoserine phosphatase)